MFESRKKASRCRSFDEICADIHAQQEEIPSLVEGGFTATSGDAELRKYCLEKSIEIFSMNKGFFFNRGKGPLEYAAVLYDYITTGKVTDFKLPSMRKTENQTTAIPKTPTPKPSEPVC